MAKDATRLILVCLSAWSAMSGADLPETNQHLISPAEAVNARVPQWIRFSGDLRARGEGFFGDRFQDGNDDLYLLQRVRLGVQILPSAYRRPIGNQDPHGSLPSKNSSLQFSRTHG